MKPFNFAEKGTPREIIQALEAGIPGECPQKDFEDYEMYGNLMLSILLLEERIFLNNARIRIAGRGEGHDNVVCYILCGDLFALGGSDAEYLTADEIPALYVMTREFPLWGHKLWVCRLRGVRPHPRISGLMKAEKEWPSWMDSLNPNPSETHG
jgi:hypothetical protein